MFITIGAIILNIACIAYFINKLRLNSYNKKTKKYVIGACIALVARGIQLLKSI